MLGLPTGQVFLVPWAEQWTIEFMEEERRIRREIHRSIVAIHHIGSTAVRGLSAKPIIDIAIEIPSFDEGNHCVPDLEKLGYSYKGTDVLPDRHYFHKGEPRTHQIHMYESGNEYLYKQVTLRDYLIANEEARIEYQYLKERLAKEYSNNKFAYSEAKTDFINKIIREAERANK